MDEDNSQPDEETSFGGRILYDDDLYDMEQEKPLTIGGLFIDGKFHEIKPSRWRNGLDKIWPNKWFGWEFRYERYDEFGRIIDEQNREGH